MKPTPNSDINQVIRSITVEIESALQDNLLGLYLTGSLSYGDFKPGRSDIDLVTIIHRAVSEAEIPKIARLHQRINQQYPTWDDRLECSYTPVSMLADTLPPKSPRPYYGAGTFYPQAAYGNEWLINNYLLYKHGITLSGPDFKSLIKQVDIALVQEACKRDLFEEWQPKINQQDYLNDGHHQSYVVLNLCRILHTLLQAEAASKTASATWVSGAYPQWQKLIDAASKWQYGEKFDYQQDTIKFAQFVIGEVTK